MKSKYVFINEEEVHESMIVHFVMVGTSEREQRKASRVQVCAAENKDVFWSKCDSTSLNDVVNNFLPSKNSSLLPTQVTY